MNAQPSIITVPLSRLRLSPRNARKTGGQDIEGLAASIAAHNLLQNLTVTPGENDNEYQVVAGGRRLAAMQLLRDRGQLAPDYSVPCKLIADDDVALEASTAENTLREAMHPADQFDAFKNMVEAKKPIPDIAAHFGVTEAYVRQRLKLGNVSSKLLKAYREGQMTLEQLQVLTLTDDHKQQEKVWFSAAGYQREPYNLRHQIIRSEARGDSLVARFVGLQAYEAAGGPVRRDLFSSSDEVFLCDRALLDRLAMDKLTAIAAKESEDGWSWVQPHINLDYDKLAAFGHLGLEPKRSKPTEAERERIKEINERLKQIVALREEEGEREERNEAFLYDEDAWEAIEAEEAALEAERESLSGGKEKWPEEAKTKSGVIVHLGHRGVEILRGRLLPGEKATAKGNVVAVQGQPAQDKQKAKAASLSQDMVLRLEMHRAAAIREHIAARPAAALQLLLTHLLTKLFTDSNAVSVLDIAPKNQHRTARNTINTKFTDLEKSPARKALDDRLAAWKKAGLPGKASELHVWIGRLSEAKRIELLALATAFSLHTNEGSTGAALAAQFDVDMATWWAPTADAFVSLVPKALLAEAVVDVAGKAEGEVLLSLKKDAAMAEAAKKLAGTGWLPKPLRGAGYKVGKRPAPKAATPAAEASRKESAPAAKKATSKAAKKPAKKAAKTPAKKAVRR